MGSEDDAAEGFKVRDRRGQGGGPEPGRPPQVGSVPEADKPRRSPESVGHVAPEPFDLPAEPELASLFLLLANSALLHLGEAPETTGAPVDLTQARFTIDLLTLLKAKTEGNRTPEETRLLEGILYDLQMRFVQAVRRG